MVPSKYTELLRGVRINSVSSRAEYELGAVSSISTDTRSLKKGDLFVAIPGDRFDGHRFIRAAAEKGVKAVLFNTAQNAPVRMHVKKYPAVLFIGVGDTRKAFGSIARNYSERFSVSKIVITGSAGKTMTRALIQSVFSQRYKTLASIESYNNDIGVPKTLLCLDQNTDVLVQEIGTNHPGEIEYLAGLVRAQNALITNIGPAHVGFFGSEEAIAREKKAALWAIPSGGTAFLNADDRFFDFLRDGLANRKVSVKTFGLTCGDVHPERVIETGIDKTKFVLLGQTIAAPVLGSHGIVNAAAAALVGLHFGLSAGEIRAGLESPVMERGRGSVFKKKGVTVIDESYNANPLSVSAALEYVGKISVAGRKAFVFGDMLELGDESERYHRALAEQVLKNGIDVLYTYGRFAGMTGESLTTSGRLRVLRFEDMGELITELKGDTSEGDLILVKGSRAMRLDRVVQALAGG